MEIICSPARPTGEWGGDRDRGIEGAGVCGEGGSVGWRGRRDWNNVCMYAFTVLITMGDWDQSVCVCVCVCVHILYTKG